MRLFTSVSFLTFGVMALLWLTLSGVPLAIANAGMRQLAFAQTGQAEPDLALAAAVRALAFAEGAAGGASDRIARSLGFAYWYSGDTQAALQHWQRVPSMGAELILWGNRARYAGDNASALLWYDTAAQLGSDYRSSVLLNEALIDLNQNNEPAMLARLEQATSHDQGWLDDYERFLGWYHWGRMLHLRDRNLEAQVALETALGALPPEIPNTPDLTATVVSEAHRYLGLALLAQRKTDEAVRELMKAIAINPRSPWAYVHYGKALYFQDARQADDVQAAFMRALELRPDDYGLWENLIGFWRWANDSPRARALCAEAVELGVNLERGCDFN